MAAHENIKVVMRFPAKMRVRPLVVTELASTLEALPDLQRLDLTALKFFEFRPNPFQLECRFFTASEFGKKGTLTTLFEYGFEQVLLLIKHSSEHKLNVRWVICYI